MSTSDTNKNIVSAYENPFETLAHVAFTYLLISLFCLLFGVIYEHFSHEVYSGYMIYAFAFPLLGGTLPFLAMSLAKVKSVPGTLLQKIYHCGIATLTVGSIVQGMLDIYGTTNSLTIIYRIAGLLLVLCAIAFYAFHIIFRDKIKNVHQV